MKILLVGGGITSALTGLCIRKLLPDCNISIWDKARGAGGRMATTRCTLNASCTADLGAQYITTTEDFMKANGDIYNDLISDGTLEPLKCKVIGMKTQGNSKNFVVPNGTSFLVKSVFQKAQINQKFSHHVSSINEGDGKWIVETKTGVKEDFDVVILTMPVPQVFLLEGTVKNSIKGVLEPLTAVTYSSRYVLVLFFLENLPNEDWGAQYIDSDPIFRYVTIDNIRRNRPDNLCAVVFHTTVSFGFKHVEDSIPDIEKVLVSRTKELFPTWPEPKAVKCHKWRYSQVTNTYPDTPGCVVLSASPLLVIGGDAFSGSKFDNCIQSSKSISQRVGEALKIIGQL